jgi:hypothetical protein
MPASLVGTSDCPFLALLLKPFSPLTSYTVTFRPPVLSVSGYKYYLVILDDDTHYPWTFPLRQKSDTFPTLSHFFVFVSTQFGHTIWSVQCDNGHEFDNSTRTFFLSRRPTLNGVSLHFPTER